jgi:8-oxo-dGTP pyrophosphatase MutT (NUDIX family)
MSKVLSQEDIARMTQEERKELASHMYNPVKICSPVSAKEHNRIIREANPKWSDEALRKIGVLSPEMQIVYTGEEMPQSFTKSIFLAGPTSRNKEVPSWRPDALQLLDDMGFDGVVFLPEDRNGEVHLDYDDQIAWEDKHLNLADCIVFWVPRDLSPDSQGFPKRAALTTNIEWGAWADSGKVVLGCPEDAEKMGYIKHYAEKYKVPFAETLTQTLKSAMDMVKDGAERSGGERYVPLFIWKLESFQDWYTAQKEAGNVLEDAKLLFSFRPNYKDWVFLWILQVNIYVSEEDRFKTTDFVMARPDISSVVMYKRAAALQNTKVIIIREYRPTASTPDGFVHELPSGSSSKTKGNKETASEEVHEETGFYLKPDRLKEHEARQLAPTFSAHKSHLYSVELTDEEVEWFQSQKDIPHGVEKVSERTFVEVKTVQEILDTNLVDWSTLGMIFSVLL